MNRYPLWKNILVAVVLALGLLYTLPNFYGEAPAVQVSSVKATIKIDAKMQERAAAVLTDAGIAYDGLLADGNSIRVRLKDGDA